MTTVHVLLAVITVLTILLFIVTSSNVRYKREARRLWDDGVAMSVNQCVHKSGGVNGDNGGSVTCPITNQRYAGWIDNELPEINKRVICMCKHMVPFIAYRVTDGWKQDSGKYLNISIVTYWMPLPSRRISWTMG